MLKLRQSILTDFADVKLAVLLLSISLLLFVLSLLLFGSLLLTQAAVTLILASLIYLLLRWARRRKQYDTDMDELQKLKKKDEGIQEDIKKIEESLEQKLKPEMSAEEIASKFRELGL